MFKVGILFSTGFFTYLEYKIVVALLVLIALASLALGARVICLRRKLTELQTLSEAGKFKNISGDFKDLFKAIHSFIG